MQYVDRALEGTDLRLLHTVLAMFGFFVSVYVMQSTQWEAEDGEDPASIRFMRRIAYALLAWAFLWSVSYADTKNWQPWPCEMMTIVAIDLILVIRALAIRARIHRTGIKRESPRAAAENLTIIS
jgi:cell division protein FtsW (lipid II flippase)